MTEVPVRGGGAATAGGVNFQAYVTAWFEVHILAESDATPPWDFPADTIIEWLACETSNYPDDLLIGFSGNRNIFGQVKRNVSSSDDPKSSLGRSFDQFVRQYNLTSVDTSITTGFPKAFNRKKDLCVLIVSPKSSNPIKIELPKILRRIGSMPLGETLSNAAHNEQERKTLKRVISLIERLWKQAKGDSPTDKEIHQFLTHVRVQELDVEQNGKDSSKAEELLRSAVLTDPTQSRAAWHSLVTYSQQLITDRAACDIRALQEHLTGESITLQAPRSYRTDIERLIEHSDNTAYRLAHLSRIQVGDNEVKLDRECTTELYKTIEDSSILVTGEPGAGKSGVLHDLYKLLKDENRDAIFFAIDQIISSEGDVLQNELGLSYDLLKIIEHWPGDRAGFIIIDALDAARSNPVSILIHDLIRDLHKQKGRWRVIASIREYDLRYSPRLQELFKGEPPTNFSDPNFSNQIHINIPIFSKSELDQISSESSGLNKLITCASNDFHRLLRIPFNLRLAGELIGNGLDPVELTQIHTASSLLEKYWQYRVIGEDRDGDARERLLRYVCESMASERTMRINRADVVDSSPRTSLDILLSNRVLIEWQPPKWKKPIRTILNFSHHMLFDFAVFKLLLEGTIEPVIDRLADDPQLIVFVRPSLVYYFKYLWTVDDSKETFWNANFQLIRSEGIPEVGKLIGTAVVTELRKDISEFTPLIRALASDTDNIPSRVLRHLFGALLTKPHDEQKLVGIDAGPWCELIDEVSEELTDKTAFTVRLLLYELTKDPSLLTKSQIVALGNTARRLLTYALEMEPRNSWLVSHAIQAVCLTFESDIAKSGGLIRQLLVPEHFNKYGYEELPRYADMVKRLCDLDPELVEEIYEMAFRNPEASEQITQLSDSKIIGMTSTRRQDFEGGLYILGESYLTFIKKAPSHATKALIKVIRAYIDREHQPTSGNVDIDSFQFNGIKVIIRTDFSAIWDQGLTHQHDPPIKMLNTFQEYVSDMVKRSEGSQDFQAILDLIVKYNEQAVIWKRLLILGAMYPDKIGKSILPLVWAVAILTAIDTTSEAGELLKKTFLILELPDKKKIEEAILSIPSVFLEKPDAAVKVRDRLLGCLELDHLVTEEARIILSELSKRDKIPPNEPPVKIGPAKWGGEYTEEQYLADEGVPVDAPANKRIRKLEEPVRDFNKKLTNTDPEYKDVEVIHPALQKLHQALMTADRDGVDLKQQGYAMGELSAACAEIAKMSGLSRISIVGEFVKKILLEAAEHPNPKPDPGYDAQFDEHPSWGGNLPRIEAAKGLIDLARDPEYFDELLRDVIKRLSDDEVPAVRFQIAVRLNAMYKTSPDTMWWIIEKFACKETSPSILQWIVAHPFRRLAGPESERLIPLVEQVFNRLPKDRAKGAQEACIGFFLSQYIWKNHDKCKMLIFHSLDTPNTSTDAIIEILQQLREVLQYGPAEPTRSEDECIRHRAIEIYTYSTKRCINSINEISTDYQNSPNEKWPEEKIIEYRELHRILDTVGSEIYFASGAFDSKRSKSPEKDTLSAEQKRFYHEVHEIIYQLSSIGFPSLVHHLVETIEFFIPVDPENIFILLARIVEFGQKGAYEFEPLAIGFIVRIVERYFAEHRSILQGSEECQRGLITILDIFVDAGWPSARQLTYRMEEIYR